MKPEQHTVKTVRLSPDMRDLLKNISQASDQSESQIIRKCLREGLKNYYSSRPMQDGRAHDRGY